MGNLWWCMVSNALPQTFAFLGKLGLWLPKQINFNQHC
jgi:hypothetical protein